MSEQTLLPPEQALMMARRLNDAVYRMPSLTDTHKQILCAAAYLMATYCEDTIAAASQTDTALERCSAKPPG